MRDNRLNKIKIELAPIVGASFAEYVGNKIASTIRKLKYEHISGYALVKQPSETPKWWEDHPYGSTVISLQRKSDGKKFKLYIAWGD